MVVFLTSSPTRELCREHPCPSLDERNGFVEQLAAVWPARGRCLMIAASPETHGLNDEMTAFYREAVENAGLPVACFDLWDDRIAPLTGEQLRSYDVLFLAGGHVPSEARWFAAIGLRDLLTGYEGVVVGTSAGSMNAARTVYAWPELEGETTDPNYELFFPGLALAETIVLPHYQKLKDGWLDGRPLMEIAASHSHGRCFYAIPDGSYILAREGEEVLFGEAYRISNGKRHPFLQEGERRLLVQAT